MDNRFGFRDLVMAGLCLLVIIVVLLAMKQYDRQYQRVVRLGDELRDQTAEQAQIRRDIGELRRLIEQGVRVQSSNTSDTASTTPATAPHTQATTATTTNPSTAVAVAPLQLTGNDSFDRLRAMRNQPDFAEGDWCVDAFGANVAKVTPLVSVDAYGAAIQARVIENLADRDPQTLQWKPTLAESWSIEDNTTQWQQYVDARMAVPLSEDEIIKEPGCPPVDQTQPRADYIAKRLAEGRRLDDIVNEPDCPPATAITFRLRQGITYSDGSPLTSDDIVWSYQWIMNPAVDAPRDRQGMENVKSVTAQGPYEVAFAFKEPYFESFGRAAGMTILSRRFYEKYTPQQFNQLPGLLIGTGPYRLESPSDWAPGKLLVLVRNQRYWGVRPAFDRLIYREVNLDAARLTMFRNREIDLFSAQPEQYKQLLTEPDLLARTRHFEFERITGGYGFIAWNGKRLNQHVTPFADARVRRAMTMLIDRQRLFDEILLGYGIPVTGPFNRLSPQTDPTIEPWPFDVTTARNLLRECGYFDRNNDGIIDGPDGQPFRFKVTFPSQTGFWDRVMLSLKDNLARAGVVMELDPLEWSVFAERIKARDFDALCMAWSGGIESDIRQMFHSKSIADGGDNFTAYSNPKLDALIDQARREVNEEKRMPLWQQCHRILHDDQPYTFLYSRKSLIFMDGRIQNIEPVRLGLNDRYEWFVPRAVQLRR